MNTQRMRRYNHIKQGRAFPGWRDLGMIEWKGPEPSVQAYVEATRRQIEALARVTHTPMLYLAPLDSRPKLHGEEGPPHADRDHDLG